MANIFDANMSRQAVDLQWMSSCWRTLQMLRAHSACGRLGFPSAVTDNFHVSLQSETNEAAY